MDVIQFISKHWAEIGVAWLSVIKVMTAVQDAVDAEPVGLKPPFGKAIYYMQAISGYLFIGNRPKSIGGSDAKVSIVSSVDTVTSSK